MTGSLELTADVKGVRRPMVGKQKTFGEWLREKRVAKGFTLRKFAEKVGISPTYLSHVEQGQADPPTAERVRTMAELLEENADQMIAMAGRVPEDLPGIIQRRPTQVPNLLREVNGLTTEQLQELMEQARKMKEKGG